MNVLYVESNIHSLKFKNMVEVNIEVESRQQGDEIDNDAQSYVEIKLYDKKKEEEKNKQFYTEKLAINE